MNLRSLLACYKNEAWREIEILGLYRLQSTDRKLRINVPGT